jgi:hypothetical protein
MVKFGITRHEQYAPEPSDLAGQLFARLARNRISFQLLRLIDPTSLEQQRLFDGLMQRMWLSGGVKRTTFRGRFSDLDQSLDSILRRRYARDALLKVHDLAASDCITSAEWAAVLFDSFPAALLTASDLTLYIVDVILPTGEVLIFERGGEPLQYVRRPFVIRLNPPEPRGLIVNYLLARSVQGKIKRFGSMIASLSGRLDGDETMFYSGSTRVSKISVVHPAAELLRAQDPRFSISRHSAFEPLSEPVDVIRSLNIFNRSYFAASRLIQGAGAVWRSLRIGGLWIVGRSSEDDRAVHRVSVFERTSNGFRLLEQISGGSEIEELVVQSENLLSER